MSNLPRLEIKRVFENILINEIGVRYIDDAFQTGVEKEVQVMIPEMTEEYERIRLQSKLNCTLSITFNFFSKVNETGVHEAVYKLINIGPTHKDLVKFKISGMYPSSSFTSYNAESSDGSVEAQVILTLQYIM